MLGGASKGRAVNMKFAMNRTCAPQLDLTQFIALAVEAGVKAVEIRNDIPGREFMDGTLARDVAARLHEAGLSVASVNALQRFNGWTLEREAEAKHIVEYAAALGAPGVVLCPVHNIDHGWSEVESEKNLRHGLRQLRPILMAHGVTGYVEPLGMKGSTMKKQAMAVAAVDDIGGWDAYKLCFDTFQFFRCGDMALFPERIGLAHMSGIVRGDLAPSDLTEPDRGLIDAIDRVDNIKQLRALKESGYNGFVSMEPFSPIVQQDEALPVKLRESLARVTSALLA
jgi:2-keto-myo-inositol isomerase